MERESGQRQGEPWHTPSGGDGALAIERPLAAVASGAYDEVVRALAGRRCVLLDGGTATELPDLRNTRDDLDERLWGTRALIDRPEAVLDVHRRYVDAGVDVLSTNTWALPTALMDDGPMLWDSTAPVHWMDVARRGVRVAREAIAEGGREGQVALAFSLNGDVDAPHGNETVRLLARAFQDEPPDLILLETLSGLRPSLFAIVESLIATGLPVWLSFRRCRHGMCSVYGQHWGGPEGDAFGRAARRFEEMGAAALLVNCIPPDHVDGIVSYLRDFTDLPLGVYPNLGYYTSAGWQYEEGIGGGRYAEMALRWREEGAQIIGGCCGVGPEHIGAARERLAGTRPGQRRFGERTPADGRPASSSVDAAPWADRRGRTLYPLPLPKLNAHPGVLPPAQASYVTWKHLFEHGIGAHQRCLEIGSGTGLQTVQLALNGAVHVHAIDIEPAAVANTLDNAFRNGVADRVTAAAEDLYPWIPDERYDVVVASLPQTPTDPIRQLGSHRPADYWGRALIDQVIQKLPDALAPDGAAYLMHLSTISRHRTLELLDRAALTAEVVAWGICDFPPEFRDAREHIDHIEQISDAHHVPLAGADVAVAYVLEIRQAGAGDGGTAASPWSPAA